MTVPDRTHPGRIRRQAARLAQLGLVEWCVPNRDRTRYTIRTTGGDEATYPREQVPAYLDGLAHAAWIPRPARLRPIPDPSAAPGLAAEGPVPIPEAERPVFREPIGPTEEPGA